MAPGHVVGQVLALAAARLGEHAAGVLSRLGGPIGHAARSTPALGKAERAVLLATARAPIPQGMRSIHATWIEAALAELPPRARTALSAPSNDPVDVWLARWATSAFPPTMAGSPSVLQPTTDEHVVAFVRAFASQVDGDPLARLQITHAMPRLVGLVVDRGLQTEGAWRSRPKQRSE